MQNIYRKWNCWKIVANDQYIATLGSGVTILNRVTLELIHHFTEIRNIHGGFFLNDNILMVFTGEQILYFLHIPEKKIIWKCPRPRQIASSGDIRCCRIPGTEKVACIATGKQSLNEHFFLVVDYNQQTIHLFEIPNCYRVVHSLVWTQSFGLTCLSYEAKGDGKLLYRITGLTEDGAFLSLLEWESFQSVNWYSGTCLFMNDYCNEQPQLMIYKITKHPQFQKLVWETVLQLPFPSFRSNGPVGTQRELLPSISWVNEDTGLLISCTPNWLGVYSFPDEGLITEYRHNNISCGAIIDNNLFIGCTPGLWINN